jgi:hypothetical protein
MRIMSKCGIYEIIVLTGLYDAAVQKITTGKTAESV